MQKRVLIIGGYGNFGSFIAERLSKLIKVKLIIAGRNANKAQNKANELNCEWYQLDIHNKDFEKSLSDIAPDIVIHTSGPFQEQNYHVAKACIKQKCHYIDLADGRPFVNNIKQLDNDAKNKNIIIISGASSVPCLSSSVINHYQSEFKMLEEIDYGISTAQKTGRGLATTQGVLSHVGEPFTTLINSKMKTIYGWQNIHRQSYTNLGKRYLSNCNIPDLDLFPKHYPNIKTIRFYAGIELSILHIGLWLLSWPARINMLPNLQNFSKPFLKISNLFDCFGTQDSAFHMHLKGTNQNDQPIAKHFQIIARQGHGPYIPCIPAIILTQKIIGNEIKKTGAMPCINLITLKEYENALSEFDCEFIFNTKDN